MSSENCNSRHFSWLMKSCFPNPHHQDHLQPQPISNATTNISSLSDDLLLECISRVSRSSLPLLASVCHRWSCILNSTPFAKLRRLHGLLVPTIFSVSVSNSSLMTTAHLGLNTNIAHLDASNNNNDDDDNEHFRLENNNDTEDSSSSSSWTMSSISLAYDFFQGSFAQARVVSINHQIYILHQNFTLRVNTWTNTFSLKSAMPFPRKKFAATVISGKIYITGGISKSSTVDEYDPVTDTWTVISTSPRRRYGCIGASADGIFYIIGGLKISPRAAVGVEAYVYASSMDCYDIKAKSWLKSRSIPGGGCVVAACAAGDDIYVLASHTVEMSFWRFNAGRKRTGSGEWCRMNAPPLPAAIRVAVDSAVRFCCVGIGERKVALIQVSGCIDDLLRRSGRNCRGYKGGLALVFHGGDDGGEWRRVDDLPVGIRRPACVCVEC